MKHKYSIDFTDMYTIVVLENPKSTDIKKMSILADSKEEAVKIAVDMKRDEIRALANKPFFKSRLEDVKLNLKIKFLRNSIAS